jgi:hypothetical protein
MFFKLISFHEIAGMSGWLSLVTPAFPEIAAGRIMTEGFFGQSLILIAGGLFLIYKSKLEIHHKLESKEQHAASGWVKIFKPVILHCRSKESREKRIVVSRKN